MKNHEYVKGKGSVVDMDVNNIMSVANNRFYKSNLPFFDSNT